ncbi:MAG: hypothetical protein NTY22_00345, partial [Proteobacteria bacterium]|nr:hypothetical protein [Pseudomonadota bacterium]
MSSLINIFLSIIIGFILGSVNWFLLYRLYKKMIEFSAKGKLSKKHRFNLFITLLLKVSVLFIGLYLVIVVF